MNKITVCENSFDPSTWCVYENVTDVREFLFKHFNGIWPSSAHVYLDHVAKNADITPYDEAGIERLGKVSGHFFVVVYPKGLPAVLLIVSIALTAASIAVALLLRPNTTQKLNSAGSPNNALGNRTNKARPNERIPDIFGTLYATFDLLAFPYKTFVADGYYGNTEYEHVYACIGRGSYVINQVSGLYQVRDDTTPLSEIDNAQCGIYGPGTAPMSGSPELIIGPYAAEPVVNLIPSTCVNGQILNDFNIGSELGEGFSYTGGGITITGDPGVGQIQAIAGLGLHITGNLDLSTYINVGDSITIGGAPGNITSFMTFIDDLCVDPAGIQPSVHIGSYLGVQCVYTVTAIFSLANPGDTLVLNTPTALEAINPAWTTIGLFGSLTAGSFTGPMSVAQSLFNFFENGSFYVGPFWLNYPTMEAVWSNFVCPQGLFRIDTSNNQQTVESIVNVYVWPCDVNGNPTTTAPVVSTCTFGGNSTDRLMKGGTLKTTVTPGPGGILIMAQKTNAAPNFTGTASYTDQTQWRDLYIISGSPPATFGNVTTVQTIIPNTPASLAIKERKLNALVTRVVQSSSYGPPVATVADIQIIGIFGAPSALEITVAGTNNVDGGFQIGDTVNYSIEYSSGIIITLAGQMVLNVVAVGSTTTVLSGNITGGSQSLVSATGTVTYVYGARASSNAADILITMALDPFIGNMSIANIDVTGIYAIAGPGGTIQNYFQMYPDETLPTQFCYTFDDDTQSFEESVADIATAIFCVAYRRGGILTLSFEQAQSNSTLLFNHRNKVPRTEKRTVSFGTVNNNDGIELVYVEPNYPNFPNVDTKVTLYFPPAVGGVGGTAVNPKKIVSVGIRNVSQATVLGWRYYWKLMAQNTTVQFDCTEEAALSVLQDRILIADNTRSDTQDGEVIAQSSLLLTLSQNVALTAPYVYSIFLQHPDETIESIPITAGSNPNQVILEYAPDQALVMGPGNYANTTYWIVSNAPVEQSPFLVVEKTPKDNKTYEVKAINYSPLYYSMDSMFSTDVDIAALHLEIVTNPAGGQVDVAALVIEVVTT
jgi:hypothetical protein